MLYRKLTAFVFVTYFFLFFHISFPVLDNSEQIVRSDRKLIVALLQDHMRPIRQVGTGPRPCPSTTAADFGALPERRPGRESVFVI